MKFFPLFVIFLFLSCSKEKSCEGCLITNSQKNGVIIYGGPIETDGCGWLVKIDSTGLFHPDELDSAFQHDQLPVKISYRVIAGYYICGIGASGIPYIHVISISL